MTEESPLADDFEECLLLVEFNGVIDEEFLITCKDSKESFQILGLQTDSPILQLGSYTFEGTFEDTLGTAVVFEKHPTTKAASGPKSNRREEELSYVTQTNKKLNLKRIFLNKKVDRKSSETEAKS